MFATWFLTNFVIKNIFHRPRPLADLLDIIQLASYPTSFSFPSGHAAFAFCAAYILAKYDKSYACLLYTSFDENDEDHEKFYNCQQNYKG